MKKTLLLFILIMSDAVVAWASKANSLPVTVIQPDGKPITIMRQGDEFFHFTTTTDGVLLAFVPMENVQETIGKTKGGYYIARTTQEGKLESTSFLAHNAGQRTPKEIELIQQQDRRLFHQKALSHPASVHAPHKTEESSEPQLDTHPQRISESVKNYFPHNGNPRAIVILVAFSDYAFKNDSATTHAVFDSLLNAKGKPMVAEEPSLQLNYGSVRQYFSDMSYGQFEPVFDVYGPVTLPNTVATYGKTNNMSLFLNDVCMETDSLINFADYDANNDGETDLVYVIFAGYGDNYSGNEDLNCIWPKSGIVSITEMIDGEPVVKEFDGKSIVRYGVHSEMGGSHTSRNKRINGIGVFCHEFSHTLGLPDLYAPSSNLNPNIAMEYWDLMDGGEYVGNNIGTCPTPYTAWEREICGWRDIKLLDKEPGVITLYPIDDMENGYGYKMESSNNPLEYFFLQYVPKTGWYSKQYGEGMLVVHVKYGNSKVFSNDHVNYYVTNRMIVKAADGLLMNYYALNKDEQQLYLAEFAGDPFPGVENVTELTDETEVNTLLFDGKTPLGQPIYNITEDNENRIISFEYMERQEIIVPTDIKEIMSRREAHPQSIHDLQGRKLNRISKPGIYIINGKKTIINTNKYEY